MIEVINFFFEILSSFWNIIYSNWIMSMMFMIAVVGFIVDLYKNSRGDKS